MGWLRKRLREGSTQRGLAVLAAVLGIYVGPAQADIIIGAIATLYGAIETLREEGDADEPG